MDSKNEKKFTQSPITIICYLLAAITLIYGCYQAGKAVDQINEYYSQYGMKATASEYIIYVFQTIIEPFINAIMLFMAGYILAAVRKLDPKNYKTDEERIAEKEAKKEAREKKQVAKGDEKAAKAAKAAEARAAKEEATKTTKEEDAFKVDFSESLEAELNAEAAASKGTAKKSGSSRSKNSSGKGGSRGSGNKNSGSKSRSKSTNGKKSSSSGSKKNEN